MSLLPSLKNSLGLARSALQAGDLSRAAAISAEAVSRGLEHPDFLVCMAHQELNAGAPQRALALAERARELAPRHVDALNVSGLCLIRLGRSVEALKMFDSALRQTPAAAQLHFGKGMALEATSKVGRALSSYERAIALEPRHVAALARLANLTLQQGNVAAARDYARRALALDPKDPAARLALVGSDVETREFQAALNGAMSLLRDAGVSPVNRAIAQSLAGDALDGLDRTTEAFGAYVAAGQMLKALYPEPAGETAFQRVQRLTSFLRRTEPNVWLEEEASSPVPVHAFLVGFPRSGTTLLEQVLGAHQDIEVMDERDCLIDSHEFVVSPDGLEKFLALKGDALKPFREAYWKRVGEADLAPSKTVFLDKMPLNSIHLCLIARLFPTARIIFALRDPRDVVLSCFRRRFAFTEHMMELLSLSGAAAYYDAVMTLCEVYREKLPLVLQETRYEDLVSDFTAETKRLCTLLSIPHDSAMADFAQRAQAVDTPSALQIARGLYSVGAGQWRRYEVRMAPVLPLLQPWAARFGYDRD